MLAVWILFLLSRPAKAVWTRIQTPSPLTLTQKVQIAEQIRVYQQALDRLNHMAANPKDLYIYLFQLAVTAFICVSVAIFVLLMTPPGMPFFQYDSNRRTTLISPYLLVASLLMVVGVVLCFYAMSQSKRMSAERIDTTRAALENSISDLTAKLEL